MNEKDIGVFESVPECRTDMDLSNHENESVSVIAKNTFNVSESLISAKNGG